MRQTDLAIVRAQLRNYRRLQKLVEPLDHVSDRQVNMSTTTPFELAQKTPRVVVRCSQTDKAVLDVGGDPLVLRELAQDVAFEEAIARIDAF